MNKQAKTGGPVQETHALHASTFLCAPSSRQNAANFPPFARMKRSYELQTPDNNVFLFEIRLSIHFQDPPCIDCLRIAHTSNWVLDRLSIFGLADGGSGSVKGWIRCGDFDLRIESTSDACLKGRTRTNGRRERCCGEFSQLANAPAKLAILKYDEAGTMMMVKRRKPWLGFGNFLFG